MNERSIDQAPTPQEQTGPPATGEKIGYRRVSTGDQNLGRQLADIKDTLNRIFEDKLSGKDRKRPGLAECIAYLRSGDVLYVHSIDRLARNLSDLQNIIAQILEKGAGVSFLKENLHFTASENDNMGKLLMQILGAFAEFERSMIKERQKEGIKIALDNGIKFGRKNVVTPEVARIIDKGISIGLSKTHIAIDCGISRQTIYNYLKSISG